MENQYNYYNSDGMNGKGQGETPFHDDNGGQKHQVPHGKKPQKKIPKAQWMLMYLNYFLFLFPVDIFWHQMLLEVKCWD